MIVTAKGELLRVFYFIDYNCHFVRIFFSLNVLYTESLNVHFLVASIKNQSSCGEYLGALNARDNLTP